MECNTDDKSSIWRMICNGEIDMFIEHWTHASVETRCKPSVELRDAVVDRVAMLSQLSWDNTEIFLKENLLFLFVRRKKPIQIWCWKSNLRWYKTSQNFVVNMQYSENFNCKLITKNILYFNEFRDHLSKT